MKKQLVVITALAATALSVFGQGFVTLSTSTHKFYDEFTTAGSGIYSAANVDYALYWAPTTATDPLSAIGSQFGAGATTPNLQVATNGVASIPQTFANLNTLLTGAGFTLGLNGAAIAGGTTTAAASAGYGQFQLANTTAGNTYQLIVVGWNASAGLSAIQTGAYTAIGWSNPFNYITGANASDPNGTAAVTSAGFMNAFGVAPLATVPTPEPATLALAGLGGASLLLFRRKK